MRQLGLVGARRGRKVRTTVPDPAAARPTDLVGRQFTSPGPRWLWVADYTYVATWSAMVYVAFVIDAYSRRILGWRAASSMKTALVLDALEQALWTRKRGGDRDLAGLIHHTDAGSQYTSIAFTDRLAAAGISASVGTVGDAYDNALAESVNGLVQDRADQATRPLAHRRAGRDRHPRIRRLVQPPPPLRSLRRHPARPNSRPPTTVRTPPSPRPATQQTVLADKGYAHDSTRAALRRRGIPHDIPERRDQVARRAARGSRGGRPPAFSREDYKQRNVVERAFGRLKQWRDLATRYAKRAAIYRASLVLILSPDLAHMIGRTRSRRDCGFG